YRDGEQARSRVPGERQRKRLRTSEFRWWASHGDIDADAVLLISDDVLAWFDEPVRVGARVAARPELESETTLEPSFDCGACWISAEPPAPAAVRPRTGARESRGPRSR